MPPPPPPPPPPAGFPASRLSPYVARTKTTTPEWLNRKPIERPSPSPGPYLFYGTLMDPSILSDILDLQARPALRPAYIKGYNLKMWGQYPALIEGPSHSITSGAVYRVKDISDGERLATYETNSYQITQCLIHYTDGNNPMEEGGYVFVYAGNPRDLSEGAFDLKVWLQRMGRA